MSARMPVEAFAVELVTELERDDAAASAALDLRIAAVRGIPRMNVAAPFTLEPTLALRLVDPNRTVVLTIRHDQAWCELDVLRGRPKATGRGRTPALAICAAVMHDIAQSGR